MTGITLGQIEAARAGIPRTLMLIGENKSASWAYRVEWPCTGMRNRGYVADWVLTSEVAASLTPLAFGRYNVVVAPRLHWNSSEASAEWIKSVRGYGCAWAYEVDDDGFTPGIAARQARLFESEWWKGEETLEAERQQRIEIINLADGVIVTTEALAEAARKYTSKPVYVIPNLIDSDWFLGRLDDTKRLIQPLTVGWTGGVRDAGDLEVVAQAWTRVAKRYPHVKFLIHGVTHKVLANSIPGDQLVLLAWTGFPDYPRALVNLDISCCAVERENEFNAAKSPIKWMETSLAGAACVVTPTVYGTVVTDGKDALLAETVDEWDEAISRLIEDEEKRHHIADQAKQSVWNRHSLNSNWHLWVEALSDILADGQREISSAGGLVHAVSV